ncbi:primosomal protein DnaI [Staphylococcus massiliensis]|uniref:Primosomal protein DnaI n=1 Tax=Staphylococcus massiliensis S46 TaxID=1229783 RepID=K9AVQ2_9STAP|nr:primosomal protein DnaI [Staphylococcus massiliensis]EKU50191.1 primosomal protein DnaI [Staphylococcus massiliensis S46]POA01674.1 primosomal protein DnaI [Staphylococcus massiliensis CCUG 55927]
MKSFGSIMGNQDKLQARIDKIKRDVLKDPDVKEFLDAHQSELTTHMIDQDLNILQEYKDQQKHYTDNHKFEDCPNFVKGHVPSLYIENGRIKIKYTPCPCKIKHDEEKAFKNLITSYHMHHDTLNANLKDIHLDDHQRIEIAQEAEKVCNAITEGRSVKGFYIYGPFGTGKSFIIGAMANQLRTKKVPSTVVYLPEFIRALKSGIKDGSFEDKLKFVREANVLMLDDIGAEEVTPWVRDEIIGPVLHYRMVNELPTFFTSNFDLDELEHHLSITRGGAEATKAARILERIKTLATPFYLDGENYRNN